MTKPTYLIIDGNSFIYRAYYALPPFSNKAGFPTQVITGFCNMTSGLITRLKPEKVVIAFDARGKNFRHELFDGYKGDRPPMDDDMRVQIEPLKQIIAAWGLPTMTVSGVEADDSMSTLSIMAEAEGYHVVMATSDKDMNQIVNDNINILDTKDIDGKSKYEPLDREGVKAKMGVYPESVIDFLSLVGDKADSIQGVHKCGEKTAVKWLEKYGDIDGIIANHTEIGGKVGEYLLEAIESGTLALARKLVKIKTDVDVGKKASEFTAEMDETALIELLNTYELRKFKKILGLVDQNAESAETAVNYDKAEGELFLESVNDSIFIEPLLVDEKDYLIVTDSSKESVYVIDIEESVTAVAKMIDRSVAGELTISSLSSQAVLKTCFKYLQNKLVWNVKLNDAKVLDFIFEGGVTKSGVEGLNDSYSNFNLSPLRSEYKIDSKNPKYKKMSFNERCEVLAEEVKICRYIILNKTSEADPYLLNLDNKMLCVLAAMESRGILVDTDTLSKLGENFAKRLDEKAEKIYAYAGEKFNINAPKQVANILFDVMEIKSKKKNTSEDVLSALAEEHPIAGEILEYRSLSKLLSTYVDGLQEQADTNNRVHTNYSATTAKTSRLTSFEPNLQNIPVKTEDGRKIRNAFVAEKGRKIVSLDYSQIDLRVLAHLSGDKKLIEAFNQNKDIHAITAAEALSIPLDEVDYENRSIGKEINFGLIYGMSAKRLAINLGIKKKEGEAYYDNYFSYYRDVKPYFEKELEFANESLFTQTLTGRKIPAEGLKSPTPMIRSYAERATKNARIQGSSSDLIKIAMVKAFEFLQETNIQAEMLLQVHDELVFEVDEENAEALALHMKVIMENAMLLSVPLVVTYDIADHY